MYQYMVFWYFSYQGTSVSLSCICMFDDFLCYVFLVTSIQKDEFLVTFDIARKGSELMTLASKQGISTNVLYGYWKSPKIIWKSSYM